jgi:hypothetical protein
VQTATQTVQQVGGTASATVGSANSTVDQTTSNLQSTATTTVNQAAATLQNATTGKSSTRGTGDPLKGLGVNLG